MLSMLTTDIYQFEDVIEGDVSICRYDDEFVMSRQEVSMKLLREVGQLSLRSIEPDRTVRSAANPLSPQVLSAKGCINISSPRETHGVSGRHVRADNGKHRQDQKQASHRDCAERNESRGYRLRID